MTRCPVCPRCEAERALERMRTMYERGPATDINWHAHAAGIAEGTFDILLEYPLVLCERHAQDTRPVAVLTTLPSRAHQRIIMAEALVGMAMADGADGQRAADLATADVLALEAGTLPKP